MEDLLHHLMRPIDGGQTRKQFAMRHNVLPSLYVFCSLDGSKVLKHFPKGIEEFLIEPICYGYIVRKGKKELTTLDAWVTKDILVQFVGEEESVYVAYDSTKALELKPILDKLIKILKKCENGLIKLEHRGSFCVLTRSDNNFSLTGIKIKENKTDISLNYNNSLAGIHKTLLNSLNSEDAGKGIVLLYGPPGTGKTSYVRHLINSINKRMIYIPPDMTAHLSDPGFITFLLKYPNSILIIEDAENVLKTREKGDNQAVSNLLNLSDGLLSDCLSLQIVCTFNTNIGNVDPALRRKGRLIAEYEFGALEASKATALSKHIGKNIKYKTETTLAEIFN